MWRLRELYGGTLLKEIPALPPGDVHVWHVSVPAPPGAAAVMHELLGADERARAARFHRAIDRDRYTVARGALRILLADYAGAAPASLAFATTEFGKPEIPTGKPGEGIAFNVSHSGARALLAFGRVSAVGVDVEAHRADIDVLQLSRMVFADPERAVLAAATPD